MHGTFFINGKNVPGRQGAVDTIVGRGHLLANHTQNHLQLTKLSGDKVVKEIADTDAFIARAQPNQPFVIRAPFGAWNGKTASAINATTMKKYVGSVFWDVGGELTSHSAADWDCWGKGVSVQRCGELYLQEIRAKKHGIVLMHDVHNKSVDMMKQILPTLKAEGYKFAALTDVPSVKRAHRRPLRGDRGRRWLPELHARPHRPRERVRAVSQRPEVAPLRGQGVGCLERRLRREVHGRKVPALPS